MVLSESIAAHGEELKPAALERAGSRSHMLILAIVIVAVVVVGSFLLTGNGSGTLAGSHIIGDMFSPSSPSMQSFSAQLQPNKEISVEVEGAHVDIVSQNPHNELYVEGKVFELGMPSEMRMRIADYTGSLTVQDGMVTLRGNADDMVVNEIDMISRADTTLEVTELPLSHGEFSNFSTSSILLEDVSGTAQVSSLSECTLENGQLNLERFMGTFSLQPNSIQVNGAAVDVMCESNGVRTEITG